MAEESNPCNMLISLYGIPAFRYEIFLLDSEQQIFKIDYLTGGMAVVALGLADVCSYVYPL